MNNEQLANATGNVEIDNKLTAFLYELMRDHLPAGKVEELVRSNECSAHIKYTNGYLADYAHLLSKRLTKDLYQ